MEKLSRTEAKEKIEEFFMNIENKTPKEIRKIKKLAMSCNIPLGKLRKEFCKKCYSPNLKVKSIRKGIKTVDCENCGHVSRWKIKIS